jgi:tRNA (guanine-N7-)-methyltransferase
MPLRAADPENLIYELPSILERLEFDRLFPRRQPVEVELGAGDGSFLVSWAQAHPDHNFMGVERLGGRIRKIDRKGRRLGLQNLRAVRIESSYLLLEYLLPRESVSALHLYFPDPWPKRKHWRHRLVNDSFPVRVRQVLVPGGVVYLRTDDVSYFEQMLSVFGSAAGFKLVETPETLKQVVTDFEREFNAQGIPTQYAAYQRD